MEEIAISNTQSIAQLGVALAIALLYFVEYQVRICEKLSYFLEKLRPKFANLEEFDKKRFEQARNFGPHAMESKRRNKSFDQHKDVILISEKITLVNSKMWSHVYALRKLSKKLMISCLITGIISFTWLLYSSSKPTKLIDPLAFLAVTLIFSSILFYYVTRLLLLCIFVEKTYRRRYIKEGERAKGNEGPEPRGLTFIRTGDEEGVVYYLERQIDYRLSLSHKYNFSRYYENIFHRNDKLKYYNKYETYTDV